MIYGLRITIGNNELEWYTSSNTRIESGKLIIEAKKYDTPGSPSSYTCSKIISRGKADFSIAHTKYKTEKGKCNATDIGCDNNKIPLKSNEFNIVRRFEASIRLPWGRGIWPAFWMLPTYDTFGGW